MTLTDPREALAEQSNFISYLLGLSSLGRVVHQLTDGDPPAQGLREADDFVHVLLGIASLGQSIDRLAESLPAQYKPETAAPSTNTRWLR
jgi:hypothetical protein